MTTENTIPQLTNAEKALGCRLIGLIRGGFVRAAVELHGHAVSADDQDRAQDMAAELVLAFILQLREEPDGIPADRQDVWIGAAVHCLVNEIQSPEDRRKQMTVVH